MAALKILLLQRWARGGRARTIVAAAILLRAGRAQGRAPTETSRRSLRGRAYAWGCRARLLSWCRRSESVGQPHRRCGVAALDASACAARRAHEARARRGARGGASRMRSPHVHTAACAHCMCTPRMHTACAHCMCTPHVHAHVSPLTTDHWPHLPLATLTHLRCATARARCSCARGWLHEVWPGVGPLTPQSGDFNLPTRRHVTRTAWLSSPNHPITQSPNHPSIQSITQSIAQSPNHPVIQSSSHPVIESSTHLA